MTDDLNFGLLTHILKLRYTWPILAVLYNENKSKYPQLTHRIPRPLPRASRPSAGIPSSLVIYSPLIPSKKAPSAHLSKLSDQQRQTLLPGGKRVPVQPHTQPVPPQQHNHPFQSHSRHCRARAQEAQDQAHLRTATCAAHGP